MHGFQSCQRWIDRHFFQPTAAQSLSLFRFLYCSVLIWKLLDDASGHSRKFGVVDWNPIPLFEQFEIGLMSLAAFDLWRLVLLIALAMTALGIFTRVSATVSWIAYFVYMGTYLGFSKSPDSNYVYHSKNIVVFILFILSVSPGVARWGFDGLWSRGWRWNPKDPSQYLLPTWPNQLIKLTLGLAYFGAGYCKVVTDPLWADGYTLQASLVKKHLLLDIEFGLWLSEYYWLCLLFGIATLVLELSFFLIVFYPRLTWFYVIGAMCFHHMILVTMDIAFLPYFGYVFLIFLDWPTLQRIAQFSRSLWNESLSRKRFLSELFSPPQNGEPAPQPQIIGKTRFATCFLIAMTGMLVFCIVGRIESWPFTDYRVFQHRLTLNEVLVFRHAGIQPDGTLHMLTRREHPISPVAINTRLKSYYLEDDAAARNQLTTQVAQHLEQKSPGQFQEVVLLKRTVKTDEHTGDLVLIDEEMLTLPLPSSVQVITSSPFQTERE